MRSIFHAGELEVQERAGVTVMAGRVGNSIHPELPPIAREFLRHQPMAIIGSVNTDGAVWASILADAPGFIETLDEETILLHAEPLPGDPLRQILDAQDRMGSRPDVGLLAIELATRKRMRVNGTAERREDGIVLHVRQAYANCPKYIQSRSLVQETKSDRKAAAAWQGEQLTMGQQAWIGRSDTFFIASYHSEGGADASHRGGNPGFVYVQDEKTLVFPDYSGNNMFNTLGNLAANPRAGLLFVDFDTGDTLQLTGETQILWNEEEAGRFPNLAGAQRVVLFRAVSVIETKGAVPLRWRLLEYSPFNPR